MKGILRSIAFNTFSLFFLTQLFTGIRILGGLPELVLCGVVLSLLSFVLKPILSIIAFPLNAITFGAFSIVINAIVLYALTLVVRQISIHPFLWPGIHIAGFVIPRMQFNTIIAFLVLALAQSCIKIGLIWLFQE